MSDEIVEAPSRAPDGKFLKGHPPVPGAGRKPGIAQSELVRAAIEPHRQALVDRAIKLALESDDGPTATRALDIALSRLAPTPRQESEKVFVPGFAEATSLQARAEAVIVAAANAEISAEAATKLLQVLDTYHRTIVATDLERRLAAIEAGRNPPAVVDRTINTIDDVGDLV